MSSLAFPSPFIASDPFSFLLAFLPLLLDCLGRHIQIVGLPPLVFEL